MHRRLCWNFSSADNFARIAAFPQPIKSVAVNKAFASVLIFLASSGLALARTAYVTDNVEIPLRSSENERSKIVKMLPNGMPLNILGDNTENGYTYVQAPNGSEGFILTRYLSNEPISRTQLEAATKKLEALQEENKLLKAEQASSHELSKERDKLSSELSDLQQTAANAIQLKQQRDQLQERVVTVERELQQLKRENQALTDSSNQDWFLYGGGLSLFGVLLGFILPKISWRRRSSGWDTF
jgi:SH3 domain protein